MAFDPRKIAGNLGSVAGSAAAAGLDKVKSAIGEITLYSTSLSQAGWDVRELEVELGLAPKLTARLKATGHASEDKLQLIVKENPDKKMLEAIVTSLIEASKLRTAAENGPLKLEDVEIGTILGAVPNVVLRFK
jgi:hypothetical protein